MSKLWSLASAGGRRGREQPYGVGDLAVATDIDMNRRLIDRATRNVKRGTCNVRGQLRVFSLCATHCLPPVDGQGDPFVVVFTCVHHFAGTSQRRRRCTGAENIKRACMAVTTITIRIATTCLGCSPSASASTFSACCSATSLASSSRCCLVQLFARQLPASFSKCS